MRDLCSMAFACCVGLSLPALAEDPSSPGAEARAAPSGAASDDASDVSQLKARLDELTRLEAARGEELSALKEEQKTVNQFLELAREAEILNTGADDGQPLRIYGFMDMLFMKPFFPKGSTYGLYLPSNSTFMMSNLNMYFSHEMSKAISSLVEIRFTFRPLGEQKTFEIEGMPGSEYSRTSTEVSDQASTGSYTLGGVAIERAHFSYAPASWLSITLGKFLTPVGIWNIDHSPTVVIPVRWPWMSIRRMIPPSQLGVQLSGRTFLMDTLFVDYALTLGNGGPIADVADLNESKAVGLRLRLTRSARQLRISVGGFAMVDAARDIKKVVQIYGLSDSPLVSEETPMRTRIRTTSKATTYCAAGDLLIEGFGLRLQSEYTWRRVQMGLPSALDPDDILAVGGGPLDRLYRANGVGNDFYVLLAYTLPLSRWLGSVTVMPYAMVEYGHVDESRPLNNMNQYIGGLNIQPHPAWVVKLEGMIGQPELKTMGDTLQVLSLQTALSF